MPTGAGHKIIKEQLPHQKSLHEQAPTAAFLDGSMLWRAWTARARSSLLAALIRARAGLKLRGPILSVRINLIIIIIIIIILHFNRSFGGQNIPKKSPNLEYMSHLVNNLIIQCCWVWVCPGDFKAPSTGMPHLLAMYTVMVKSWHTCKDYMYHSSLEFQFVQLKFFCDGMNGAHIRYTIRTVTNDKVINNFMNLYYVST